MTLPLRPSVLAAVFAALTLSACASSSATKQQQAALLQQQGQSRYVWACHNAKRPRWLRVAAPAASAHRGHGDRVVTTTQVVGRTCTR